MTSASAIKHTKSRTEKLFLFHFVEIILLFAICYISSLMSYKKKGQYKKETANLRKLIEDPKDKRDIPRTLRPLVK